MKKRTKKRNLLVALDMNASSAPDRRRSEAVKAAAGALAKAAGGELDLVHVEDLSAYPVGEPYFKPFIERLLRKQERGLRMAGKGLGVPTRSLLLSGRPADELLRRSGAYDMIALGTHGRKGASRLLLGSVAEEVVRHSRVPVLVVGAKAQEARRRKPAKGAKPLFLVATDLGRNSLRAEREAAGLAAACGGKAVLYYSFYEGLHPTLQTAFTFGEGYELGALYNRLKRDARRALARHKRHFESLGIECETILDERTVTAASGLLAAARKLKPDYVVAGTHGRNLVLSSFLGSTARRLILEAEAPVIIARSRS